MSVVAIKIGPVIDNTEEWLREGADAQEFQETLTLMADLYKQSELFQRRGVAYAWECGKALLRIKSQIRYGYWMPWKREQEHWASSRKIELYCTIAKGFDSANDASIAATTIAGAEAVIKQRQEAEKQGRTATKAEEAAAEEKASLALNDEDITAAIAESETASETYRHKVGVDGFAECNGDGLLLSERIDEVDCPACLIAMKVAEPSIGRDWETIAQQQNSRGNGQRLDHASDQHLRNKYGITGEQWDTLFEIQGRVCAICGSENEKWQTDHDHKTGRFRGVLCRHCNISLGWFEKRRQKILAYLDR